MAYLGFQKGGAKCSLDTCVHTKGGQTKFPILLVCQKNFFLAKGGPWPNGPLNTPLESGGIEE